MRSFNADVEVVFARVISDINSFRCVNSFRHHCLLLFMCACTSSLSLHANAGRFVCDGVRCCGWAEVMSARCVLIIVSNL